MQVKDKMEAELKELEHVCDMLKAAERKQQGYQEKLISWERTRAEKCKTLRDLQVQVLRTCLFLKINEKIMWKKGSGTFFFLLACVTVVRFPLLLAS